MTMVYYYTYYNSGHLSFEFFLLPTVSRPVSLGIGPPFGPLTIFYLALLLSFDNYVILLSMRLL
jgi:hypothetical protein